MPPIKYKGIKGNAQKKFNKLLTLPEKAGFYGSLRNNIK